MQIGGTRAFWRIKRITDLLLTAIVGVALIVLNPTALVALATGCAAIAVKNCLGSGTKTR